MRPAAPLAERPRAQAARPPSRPLLRSQSVGRARGPSCTGRRKGRVVSDGLKPAALSFLRFSHTKTKGKLGFDSWWGSSGELCFRPGPLVWRTTGIELALHRSTPPIDSTSFAAAEPGVPHGGWALRKPLGGSQARSSGIIRERRNLETGQVGGRLDAFFFLVLQCSSLLFW